MQTETLLALVEGELNERKALDMTVLNVRERAKTSLKYIVLGDGHIRA